jgi:outer membrane receptor for ferrienterochelin and colicin
MLLTLEKKKYAVFLIILMVAGMNVLSQKYTISGFVEDPETGERLIGVNVYNEQTLTGTMTNTYGFYSLTLPADTIHLVFSHVGYQPVKQVFYLASDTSFNFRFEAVEKIEEVAVYANKTSIERSQMSMNQVQPATINKLPVLLGEKDLIKTLQLLPGVQSGSEGSSSFYVRGGGPDQNLILLDGVPVYNVNHLFGFFSVFNTDAIQNVTLIKGGFPARYGGRLSSVLDIRLKEGNNKEYKAQGSVGLISSKLTLEGPIVKNKSSFLISGRRTYIDVLSQPAISMINQTSNDKIKAGYFFHDLNVKLNYLFSDKDRVFLSVYTGKDKAYSRFEGNAGGSANDESFRSDMELWWGNITGALRWNHVFSNRLFSNTTITYSRYKFLVGENFKFSSDDISDEFDLNYFSGINDLSCKIDFDYSPSPAHQVKFGGNYIYHVFHPGINAFSFNSDGEGSIDTTFGNKDIYSDEFYLYAEDDINITKKIKTNIGLHYSGFHVENTFYHSLQPRIALRYKITQNMALKGAYTHMAQYIHLLSNTTIGLPTDLWLPVTKRVKPQKSNQYAVGGVYSFRKHGLEVSIEGFYKDMQNLIEYKEGASFFSIEDDWEDKIEFGNGWAYGGEVLIEKNAGKTTGWIAYTLSWSNRRFENISFGRVFPASYDRRHDISVTINHKFSEKFDIGVVWVYGTGYPVTLALEKYPYAMEARTVYEYHYYQDFVENIEHRNNYRMPAYHRLDIGFNFHKQKERFSRTWSFGLYNAYNRINPFFLYFGYSNDDDFYYDNNNKVLKMIGLFPIFPFVSYSFKF